MYTGKTQKKAFLLAFSFLLFIQSATVLASPSFFGGMEALLKNEKVTDRLYSTKVKGKILEVGTKEPLIGASDKRHH